MANPAEVTAVVVTHHSADVVEGCLDSLVTAFSAPPRIVVVDSGSDDDSAARARLHPVAAEVIELGVNRGYAAGVNAADRIADPGCALLVLNPDIRLSPGSGDELLRTLEDPQIGLAVPVLTDESGVIQGSLRRRPSLSRALGLAVLGRRSRRWGARWSEESPPTPHVVAPPPDWATGAAMLISSECRAVVGAWDESYFLYTEETDYCLRAGAAGFATTLVPRARAVHFGGELATSPKLYSIMVRNRVAHYRRQHRFAPALAHWLVVLLGESARALAGSVRSRAAVSELLSRRPIDVDLARARDSAPAWVCFSALDWWYHNHGHADFQLARRLARTRTVLLVNSIGMRMPTPGNSTQFSRRLVRKAKSTLRGLRRPLPDVPRFYVLTCVTLPFYSRPVLRRLNTVLVRAQVQLAQRLLGIREPVLMVTLPTAEPVVSPMARRSLVFNRSDKHSSFSEVDQPYVASLEKALLATSDTVVYVSHQLMGEDADAVGDRAFFLDHGVDLRHFQRRSEVPADLVGIAGPVIGFFGGIDDYVVDIELLEKVAAAYPEASLVLIGDATCSLAGLEALPNVHLLGYRPYESIPAYGTGFDVALMPWLQNEWIEACNPIKVKEYLALGLPTVTTYYPELERYTDVLLVAKDHDAFIAAVRTALEGEGPDPAACRRAVLNDSWDGRARALGDVAERGH